MKKFIQRLPVVRSLAKVLYFGVIQRFTSFPGSNDYWRQRYQKGGNSGAGSYDRFATFKADVLNRFVDEHNVSSVIEYGCGDGNQLKLANYPEYLGFDISIEAIRQCEACFASDNSKRFSLMEAYKAERAELTLSLDVIYHLVEDGIFEEYMGRLFESAEKYVIVYSSNSDSQFKLQAAQVRHRNFVGWVDKNQPGWQLLEKIPNKYPYQGNELTGSFADFYVFTR